MSPAHGCAGPAAQAIEPRTTSNTSGAGRACTCEQRGQGEVGGDVVQHDAAASVSGHGDRRRASHERGRAHRRHVRLCRRRGVSVSPPPPMHARAPRGPGGDVSGGRMHDRLHDVPQRGAPSAAGHPADRPCSDGQRSGRLVVRCKACGPHVKHDRPGSMPPVAPSNAACARGRKQRLRVGGGSGPMKGRV